jgi:hypothetical protein
MTRRPAVTLIEALVAIFVMAIGLLALLTLFPLGAVQMAQALKDQRTAEAAAKATAHFKAFNLANDQSLTYQIPPNTKPTDPRYYYFENNPAYPGSSLPPLQAGYNIPTYPVFMDPTGVSPLNGLGMGSGVGQVFPNVSPIPRVPVSNIPSTPSYLQTQQFSLLDDLTFGDNGLPDTTAGLQREGRYTWAYMLRRVRPFVQSQPVPLDLTVVVYSGRAPGGPGVGETIYTNTQFGASGPNVVSIPWSGTKPALRRGSWVLDARMVDASNNPAPQGYFYRVVNVTDLANNVVEIEVQSPLGGPLRTQNNSPTGPLIVMENVVEVFEKGINY